MRFFDGPRARVGARPPHPGQEHIVLAPTVDTAGPKLSVCVLTYNHAQFISGCLQSILDQETAFDFEILVGDDCSTDGTTEIITDFERRYPGKIKVFRRERNAGGSRNFIELHNAAKGDYVAHIDGDDLALPGKLTRQVTLLDQKSELVVCGHKVAVIAEDGTPTGRVYPFKLGEECGLGKVIRCGNPFLLSTIMYRRSARTFLSPDFPVFDWYFLTDLMKSGKAGYLERELGLYRIHTGSFTGTRGQSYMLLRMVDNLSRRLSELPRYRADFFAFALFEVAFVIGKKREAPPAVLWRLLRDSASFAGIFKVWDTVIWRIENWGALAR
jgi:glycosyltransferase involved in cell wall biosynthesis